jgi:hypothetical protein
MLSVQVHPGYSHANILPVDGTAKPEAWVIHKADQKSRIDADPKPGATSYIPRQSQIPVARYRSTATMLKSARHGAIPNVIFPLESIGEMIQTYQTASMSITGWPPIGLAWHVSMCRKVYLRKQPPIRRERRYKLQDLPVRRDAVVESRLDLYHVVVMQHNNGSGVDEVL